MKNVVNAIEKQIKEIQKLHHIKASNKKDFTELACLIDCLAKIKITNPELFKY